MTTANPPSMRIANSASEPFVQPGMNYFSPDRHLVGTSGGFHETVYPNPMNPNTPILQFEFWGERTTVVDMRSIHLKVKARILAPDGTTLTEADEGTTANNLLHTLFQTMSLQFRAKWLQLQ